MSAKQNQANGRERILDATVALLRMKGPNASGTAEILARAHAPRGSFYFHFPDGKDQLIAESIDRHSENTAQAIKTALADRSVPISQRIEKLIINTAGALIDNDYQVGCAVGATVLEASATSPSLRQATAAAFTMWTSIIAAALAEEGIEPELSTALADTIIAGLEGAEMMARSLIDPAPLQHVARTLATVITAAVDQRHAT